MNRPGMGLMFWLRRLSSRLLPFFCCLLFTQLADAQSQLSQFEFKKVGTVNIQADAPIDLPALMDLIEITPNVDIVTPSKIRRSIELLYATGNFSNVLVDAKMVNDRVNLTFITRQVYRIEFIRLSGQTGISKGKIRKRIQLRKLEPYTPEKVLKGRSDILAALQDDGYFTARVTQDVLLHRLTRRAEIIYTIQSGPPTLVRYVNFTGAPHFTRETLLSVMKTKPGTRFKDPDFTRDQEKIEGIYDRNGFLEHQIEVAKKELIPPNHIDIEIHINAGDQLLLTTHGFQISDKTLRDQLPIWTEHSYNDDTLEEGKRNLVNFLQTKGYYDAKVTWAKDFQSHQIIIVYQIDAGVKYAVRKITISGNKHMTDRQIRNFMQTNKTGLFGAQRLVTKVFEGDIGRIVSAYRQLGFLFASVTKRDITRFPDQRKLHINLQIEEGPEVTVAEIRLRGNKVLSNDYLLQHFQEKIGQPVSEAKVKADSNYIVATYSDRGYPKMRMENRLLLSNDKTRAIIEYRINEGEKVTVDRIVISGNYRTDRKVITENLFFKEDDPFSLQKIIASQSKLYSLNIFDRVDIAIPRPDQLQSQQDVPVHLTEARPYTISYGVGYQTFDLLRGLFAISDRNLFGTGRSLALQTRGGIRESRAVLTYTDPHLLFHDVTNSISAFADHGQRPSFDYKRFGAGLQIERKLSTQNPYLVQQVGQPSTSLFFRYDFENIRTTGGLTPSLDPIDREFLAIHLSSVTPSFVRDARDNSLDPTRGNYLSSQLQWATKLLGSGPSFLKWFSQAQYFHPFRGTVVATSLRVGLAQAFEKTHELPLSQRFFAGGGRSIRGFELDTAGPLDPTTGEPLGGNSLFILNIEDRFPIYKNLGGVIFFDYGNVFELILGPNGFHFGDLRKTSGFGLRYKTPIGPLTIDWGKKLDRRPGESPSEFFVSVGHAF